LLKPEEGVSPGVASPPWSESNEEEELPVVVVVTPCWGVGSGGNSSLLVAERRPRGLLSLLVDGSTDGGSSSAVGERSLW